MNDTTLPIPSKPSNPRVRRPPPKNNGVRQGFGLHDWMTLLRHAKDLAQRKGAPLRDITLAEVKLHNKPYDGWMALRGKVYNVTPYLAYHPGGSDIMEKCLGRDATVLFDKYHSWVNLDGLVGPLLLGHLKVEKKRADDDNDGGYLNGNGMGMASNNNSGDGNNVVIMPAASTTATTSSAATTTTSFNDMGFAMPKPRPPKGEPIASLLPLDDEEDEREDDAMQL
mmetsp:Transcript_32665/g.58984  ORF Transcript_32665/g.58984 Transcript_32665/m.58984 type:complete len:225 (+) Transcript_32665:365-1039(+)|eukprot:CAMPEP_0201941812 /NCGR_PEP_ID=MMETSP0903-20130614/47765_1 /ASSEMBLY_ACC=CAM_ASM_000552 /TAXON_ID=420261 /ORGANISM="Thalassiosira antarctica, Strain CCMP982" /LENGTH=224 /DNA_ID=CAMNT_0048483981 /DNA_START=351 /DNA_END=1025 /DNA_ORIENTATION=+